MNLGDKQGEMVVLEPLNATPAPVEPKTASYPVTAMAEGAELERVGDGEFVEVPQRGLPV